MANGFIIDAPCKINLHLRVLGKRHDGFHDLESIFMALNFGDTLRLTVLDDDGGACKIIMKGNIPPEKNLMFKAVSLFREYTGFSRSISIDVQKRIPFGAGLGGGSSDAASTLIALNELGNCGLKYGELCDLAVELGSDVPFFLNAGTAFVSGRGENIEALKTPDQLWIVLVNPGFSSGTAEAFLLLDEHGVFHSETAASKHNLIEALGGDPSKWPYQNDFLPVFLSGSAEKEAEKKAYQDMLTMLQNLGALFAGLSGAGATCFGVFKDKKNAEKAVKSLKCTGYFIKLTFPLARRGVPVLEY